VLDGIDKRTILIHSVGNAPQAQLGASQTQISAGGRVDFNSAGSADPDGGPVTSYWDFGDPQSGGETNHSTAPSASHVFARAGSFLVRLAITDDEGSTVTRTVTITVR